MTNPVKIGIYVVLSIALVFFGLGFRSEYKKLAHAVGTSVSAETNELSQTNAVASTNSVGTNETTNVTAAATNLPSTTNAAAVTTTSTNQDTNGVAETTNATAAATNAAVSTGGDMPAEPLHKMGKGKMMTYGGAFLGALLILGMLLAYDMAHAIGNRSIDFMFNDDLEGVHDAEYDQAEALWANGKPLDAIQAMRDYLKKNPREIHVARRIAEIYEKDLHNYLAAILEYEEILKPHPKYRLSDESWGWCAIHLCNLYTKTDNIDKSLALLRRIVDEYGDTPAAAKARKRIGMYESLGDVENLRNDTPDDATPPPPKTTATPAAAPAEDPAASAGKAKAKRIVVRVVPKKAEKPEENPGPKLPPGFRPKTKS